VLTQIALNWSTLEPAVASVTNGLVTAIGTGSARIVVSASSASGAIADTVPVTVGPAGSSFCGAREPLVPAVGEVIPLLGTTGAAERCIGANVAGAEFALVALNSSTTFGATDLARRARARRGHAPRRADHGELDHHRRLRHGSQAAPISTTTHESDGGFDQTLRLRERRELAQHVSAAREQFASRLGDQAIAAQVALPTVGSIVTLNAQALSACSQANNRAGRVVAVSDRAIIVADTANPTGGYTDDEYRDIAATFDTLTYPLDVEYFGEPTNIGGTGRITLFYHARREPAHAGQRQLRGGWLLLRARPVPALGAQQPASLHVEQRARNDVPARGRPQRRRSMATGARRRTSRASIAPRSFTNCNT
jgi:hypothetical protein